MELESQHRPGRYLAVQIAGKYYAFQNEAVREITPVRELFPPLLGSSSELSRTGLAGFLHTQSSRLPVFDLHVRLGGAERQIRLSTQTRIVVVEVHGARAAFYADRLTDMIYARAHEIRRDSIVGHGRPKAILILERLWTRQELAELA
ncbi:MAG TPA: chemotaxis protein CheW [Bryobacteraceae bacterium]|jgi:chemotaxis signal transduction protein